MKITLVAIHPHPSPQAVPLACAFLKEALLADTTLSGKLDIAIAEFFLGDPAEECARKVLETAPDLVGFSIYVWNRDLALALAAALRETGAKPTLCAGGAEATANPVPLLESGLLDFVVCGEGEAAFPEAVRRIAAGGSPAGAPGVAVPGTPLAQLPAPLDLQSLPSPYLSGQLDPIATGGALWQISRGCDFACAFCFDHKGSGGVRRFPLSRIEAELRLFARLGVPQVFVLDSTFNKIPQRAKEILRLIRKLAPQVHFHFEVRSEYLDPEMAELFASITCSLQIGLQSADKEVLRSAGRGFDPDDFHYRVSLLNNTGAIFGFDLIYGLPGDTLATFRRSLDFALSLYPNHLDIFPLAVLPGTRLHRRSQELSLRHLEAPPYTVQQTPGFPPRDLEQARRLATACDVLYSRGKAVAWFNSICHALKTPPAALLDSFAAFLAGKGAAAEEEIADEVILPLQVEFLSAIFQQRKKTALLPLALDLVRYHHDYASALLAPPPRPINPKEAKRVDVMTRPLSLAPCATLGSFHYEILDILESGEIDLVSFASSFDAPGSYAIVYPSAGQVCTESISEPYYLLLQGLDGKKSARELCRKLSIPTSDAVSFLRFALTEGIVAPC